MKKRLLALVLVLSFIISLLPTALADDNTEYVGWLLTSGVSASSGDVPNIYISDRATYDAASDTNKLTAASGTVAYCFNMGKYEPFNRSDGWWYQTPNVLEVQSGRVIYHKSANADNAEFLKAADNERSTTTGDLRQWVISVGLNGYPLDYSGFNTDADGNKILEDPAFRVITQRAIWYYTDSAPNSYTMTEKESMVYNKLISTLLPSAVTDAAASSLDLYVWDENPAFTTSATAWDGYAKNSNGTTGKYVTGKTDTPGTTKGYQNLLAVSTTYKATLPTYKSLTLTKSVVNGSDTDAFNFTVTLSTSDFWYDNNGALNVVQNGTTLTATLGDKDSITIYVKVDNKDSGFGYTISETADANYDTSVTVDGTAVENPSTDDNKITVSGTGVTADKTAVVYTNTEKDETETGSNIGTLTVKKVVPANSAVPDDVLDQKFTFTVALTKDGVAYTGPTADEAAADSENLVEGKIKSTKKSGESTTDSDLVVSDKGTITFTLKRGESIDLTIPHGIHYTVTETAVDNFITTTSGATGTLQGNHTATFTNTYNNNQVVIGTKTWDDAGHTAHRPSQIDFQFYIDGTALTTNQTNGSYHAPGSKTDATWSYKFSNRPIYTNRKAVVYTVEEVNVPEGYRATVDGMNITNTYDASLLNTLKITKNVTGTDRAFTFTVTINDPNYDGTATKSDGTEIEAVKTKLTGTPDDANNVPTDTTVPVGVTFTFTLKNGETATIPALYSGTEYTVSEALTSGYTLRSATGYWTKNSDVDKKQTELTATDGVFSGVIENEVNDPYTIELTYNNAQTSRTTSDDDDDDDPTPTKKTTTPSTPTETKQEVVTESVPDTGDDSALSLWLSLAVVSACGVAVVRLRKKRRLD